MSSSKGRKLWSTNGNQEAEKEIKSTVCSLTGSTNLIRPPLVPPLRLHYLIATCPVYDEWVRFAQIHASPAKFRSRSCLIIWC